MSVKSSARFALLTGAVAFGTAFAAQALTFTVGPDLGSGFSTTVTIKIWDPSTSTFVEGASGDIQGFIGNPGASNDWNDISAYLYNGGSFVPPQPNNSGDATEMAMLEILSGNTISSSEFEKDDSDPFELLKSTYLGLKFGTGDNNPDGQANFDHAFFWNKTGQKLQISAANGLSHVFSDGTSVPLPAAAWLFGSAMLGLAGIGYRRKAKQA
ncbi:VPLPA-CTERM sorting domain-containing protein [Thiorhodococcus minor]|uniref:VPLPA-CTERM sorting domain-containing protein n=1 Tax=Thiorhodococcus minor TaxID=57489 RepID=UPI001ADAC595|nr:VPLPA-CTERM sorting domain-containing protein [Thiorhodococcus minor]